MDRPALTGNRTRSSIRAGSGQRGSRTNHSLLLAARCIFVRFDSKPKHQRSKRETERLGSNSLWHTATTIRAFIQLFSVLTASFLTVCMLFPTHAEPLAIEVRPTEIYTNKASHFRFPPSVQDFKRVEVIQYDRDGQNIGAGYNHHVHKIAATVFVYPIPKRPPDNALNGHFETCKADVLRRHEDARVVSEGIVQVSPGGKKRSGKHAEFTLTDSFAGQRQSLRSEVYLFTHGQWFIKLRVTYPTREQASAAPVIKAFIDGLAWP